MSSRSARGFGDYRGSGSFGSYVLLVLQVTGTCEYIHLNLWVAGPVGLGGLVGPRDAPEGPIGPTAPTGPGPSGPVSCRSFRSPEPANTSTSFGGSLDLSDLLDRSDLRTHPKDLQDRQDLKHLVLRQTSVLQVLSPSVTAGPRTRLPPSSLVRPCWRTPCSR